VFSNVAAAASDGREPDADLLMKKYNASGIARSYMP